MFKSKKFITAQEVGEAKVEIIRRYGNYSQNLKLDGIIMEVNFMASTIIDPISWVFAKRKMKRIEHTFNGLVYEVEDANEHKREEIIRVMLDNFARTQKNDNKKNRRVYLRDLKERLVNGNPAIVMDIKEPLNIRAYIHCIEDLLKEAAHGS